MKKYIIFPFLLSIVLLSCNRDNDETKLKAQPIKKVIAAPTPKKSTKKKVAIYRLGSFDIVLFHYAQSQLDSFYNIQTIDCGIKELPINAFVKYLNKYVADTLLKYLFINKSKDAQYVLGLTEKDICTKDGNNPYWGIFGLGWQPGPACVISTKRIGKGVSNAKLKDRFAKIILHEMGHNFGLDHCTNHECLMEPAKGKISTVDKEKKQLCGKCRKIIKGFL